MYTCTLAHMHTHTHTHTWNGCTGCGTGNYTALLSKYVGKVTGLELNGGMLAQAKGKTAAMTNVGLHSGNILDMPFSNGMFDGVICNQVCKAVILLQINFSLFVCVLCCNNKEI